MFAQVLTHALQVLIHFANRIVTNDDFMQMKTDENLKEF